MASGAKVHQCGELTFEVPLRSCIPVPPFYPLPSVLTPYHFVQLRSGSAGRFYAELLAAAPTAILCFDLEDSLETTSISTTRALREQHRRRLLQLADTQPDLPWQRVLVRVNAPGATALREDIELLRQLPALHAIILPKLETRAALNEVLAALPAPIGQVIPVIETAGGWQRLPEIVSVSNPRFTTVALGHCDLNLSFGHFPFHHQDSPVYWQWVDALDRYLTEAGKFLLNSPVLRLADEALFRTVLCRLRQYRSIRGQITLSRDQTRWCAENAFPPAEPPPGPPRSSPESAERLLAVFENHRVPGSALALTPARELISPHEAEAARRWLSASAARCA